jgi:hypothetical protein
MPPAMYFMELMTCNSKIDEETERLFPALFATFEEEERQKLEDKLTKLKAVRYTHTTHCTVEHAHTLR